MVISSNALVHFMKSKEDLFDILENEFRPRYCLENLSSIFGRNDQERWQVAFPMACFCDLPLSQLGEHLDFYGEYGIGMTKEWGIANGINPVLYLHPKSDLAKAIADQVKHGSGNEASNAMSAYMELLNHIKPYDGYTILSGKQHYKRFYDEKEWRWAPLPYHWEKPDNYSLSQAEFSDPEIEEAANRKLADLAKLSFAPDDIKYIIVATEAEILPMIRKIESIQGKYSSDTVKLLASKIISVEHIKADF